MTGTPEPSFETSQRIEVTSSTRSVSTVPPSNRLGRVSTFRPPLFARQWGENVRAAPTAWERTCGHSEPAVDAVIDSNSTGTDRGVEFAVCVDVLYCPQTYQPTACSMFDFDV